MIVILFSGMLAVAASVPQPAVPMSVTPSSFFAGDVEEFVTVRGTALLGEQSTQIAVSGPAGDFTRETSGGFRDSATGIDAIYLSVPEPALRAVGRYAITVCTDSRVIGPVFFYVIPRPAQAVPTPSQPE